MFLLTLHCRPYKNYPDKKIGGAYVNCYIVSKNMTEALKIAYKGIKSIKWKVIEEDEITKVNTANFRNSTKLKFYK